MSRLKKSHGITESQQTSSISMPFFQPLNEFDKLSLLNLQQHFFELGIHGEQMLSNLTKLMKEFEDGLTRVSKYIKWNSQNMNDFFIAPFKLPKAWTKFSLNYTNILVVILSDALLNSTYRLLNEGSERKKSSEQILKKNNNEDFFESLNIETYVDLERYLNTLYKTVYQTHYSESDRFNILIEIRKGYLPPDMQSLMSNTDFPHLRGNKNILELIFLTLN